MKKFLKALTPLLLVIFLLMSVGLAIAVDKQLLFTWDQELSSDFYGWKLYISETSGDISETSGGSYTQFGADVVYTGTPANQYSSAQILTSPDGVEKEYFFVVNAWDKSGNFSADSNEVSIVIDFLAPNVPVSLTVAVQPVQP